VPAARRLLLDGRPHAHNGCTINVPQIFSFLGVQMKAFLYGLILFVANSAVIAQNGMVLIHIKIIDGRTGLPMKNEIVGLEEETAGYPHRYPDISARADASGIATIRINPDSVILQENTHEYVNCGDENGGLVHNAYKVSEIVSSGIVQSIVQSKLCTKISGSAKQGELILFVRPWLPGEDM
jgi:hypothetical protein